MRCLTFLRILTAILAVLCFCASPVFPATIAELYEQGAEKRDSGDWQAALNIWATARDSTETAAATDPRIGFAFVELVTQQQDQQRYPQASEMYFWGLARADIERFESELKEEISRMSPIIPEEKEKSWLKSLERKQRTVLDEIRAFWVRADPLPTSAWNERLIEHWRRIAIARQKFQEEDNTVYNTDDRGLVFVKYGTPDRRYEGKLGIDQQEIMRWIDDFLLRQEIERFNAHPDIEIWIYEGLRKDGSAIFIFGREAGYGKYGLRYGVEDFIPDRAFRRSSTHNTQGILPGAMLQLTYYRELLRVDQFFLERYRDLEARWRNARSAGDFSPDHDALRGLINHYRSMDKKTVQFENLPIYRTNAFEGLERLYLNYKAFRYLDYDNQPRLNLTVVSDDQPSNPDFVVPFFKQAEKTRYKHRHILINYDEKWEVEEREVQYPDLHNYNTSLFNFVHETRDRYSLAAEKVLLDIRKSELELADLPDTARVIGVQSEFIGTLEPLSTDKRVFEVSDVIVGETTPKQLSHWLAYPFPVVTQDPVKSDLIKVYFQLYNLSLQNDIKAVCRLQCQINAIKNHGKEEKREKRMKQEFDLEFFSANTNHTIELDISDLKPGLYELIATFEDRTAKQQRVRSVAFRVAG